jgi:predicted ATPase
MRDLPSGTVTFVFTDVEGSTRLLHELGPEAYADALAEHRRVLREAFRRNGGVEVDTQGDSFFVAFSTAPEAVAATREAQKALAVGPIRTRMGLHTGVPLVTAEGYVGADVHRAARIAAAGHGGQVLLSAATAALVDQNGLRDLGEHRLKDLSAPERLYQIGGLEFPRLNSLYQTNLPVQSSPLVGREPELAEVTSLIRHGTRLLTLTGAGGSGKTRLALHAGAALADDFPDGVWFVPLAPLADPSLVGPTVASVVGATDDLRAHLRDKRLLLVVDNFEHLLDAAVDLDAALAEAPGVCALVTSRERLHLSTEHEYAVPTLPVGDAAVLFVERARRFEPRVELADDVFELARSLDGLPLAIELAAARIKVLTVAQIRERLERNIDLLTGGDRDLPERQRTLRATIEWSYELLDERAQAAFAALSVFPATFAIDAAEAVVGVSVDLLASLVDKSLLRHAAGGRFFMLATIREFARGRLESEGQPRAAQAAHAAHYLEFAALHRAETDADVKEWLDRFELEHDNFRAALSWYAATADAEHELALAEALARFWVAHGHLFEARRRLEHAVAGGEAMLLRARALRILATIAYRQRDFATAADSIAKSAELHERLGDDHGLARSLATRGNIAVARGDTAAAKVDYAAAEPIFRRVGDAHGIAISASNLAYVALLDGDQAALDLCQASVRATRDARGTVSEAVALLNLAFAHVQRSEADAATAAAASAADLAAPLGHKQSLYLCVEAFAAVAALRGEGEKAARLFAAAEAARAEVGDALDPFEARIRHEAVAAARALISDDAFDSAFRTGSELTTEEAIALGRSIA